jgi:phosphate transport system substrate-binding protein
VLLVNHAGKAVAPSAETFQAAAANADWAHSPAYDVILTDQPGAASWPITGASFILVYREPSDPDAVLGALKFFAWAYKDGGKMAADLDYVPVPPAVVALVRKTWTSSITANGKPVWSEK